MELVLGTSRAEWNEDADQTYKDKGLIVLEEFCGKSFFFLLDSHWDGEHFIQSLTLNS